MKKILIPIFAVLLCLGMAGCGEAASQNTNSTPANSASSGEPQELILGDANFVLSSSGYVHYAVEIQNPNTNWAANSATIELVGKHSDGSIAFSDDWSVGPILPGSTTYWANQAGDGSSSDGDTLDISITVQDRNWNESTQELPADLYTFNNVSVNQDKYGMGMTAKGEITLNQEFEGTIGHDAETPMLVCILRDADGAIITGFDGFMFGKDLSIGKATTFDISGYFPVRDFATAEMYANPW